MLACLLLAAVLPVIWTGDRRGRAAYDSLNYHEKAIRQFALELPAPNLRDYLSATTPGYHLVVAVVGRAIGSVGFDGEPAYDKDLTPLVPNPTIERERRVLQLAGLCFSLALMYVLGSWVQRSLTPSLAAAATPLAVALCLPLAASPYVYQSAAWLLPDNSAWLGVAAIMLLSLRPQITVRTLALAGATLIWLVLARQVHAWAAGLIWAAAWLGASLPKQPRTLGPLLSPADMLAPGTLRRTAINLAIAALATLPAAAVLLALSRTWGGQLVPPTFVTWHGSGGGGVQWATPAFLLSFIALIAPFLAGWWLPGFKRAWTDHRAALLVSAVAGIVLATLPPSGYGVEHGRFGGVWNLYRAVGSVGERSIALALLAPLGALVVTVILSMIDLRSRWIMLASLAGFAIANALNPQLWQRYHEPFALLWLIIAAALAHAHTANDYRVYTTPGLAGAFRLWRAAGPVSLAALLAALGWLAVVRTPPQTDEGYRLGTIETPPAQSPHDNPR